MGALPVNPAKRHWMCIPNTFGSVGRGEVSKEEGTNAIQLLEGLDDLRVIPQELGKHVPCCSKTSCILSGGRAADLMLGPVTSIQEKVASEV